MKGDWTRISLLLDKKQSRRFWHIATVINGPQPSSQTFLTKEDLYLQRDISDFHPLIGMLTGPLAHRAQTHVCLDDLPLQYPVAQFWNQFKLYKVWEKINLNSTRSDAANSPGNSTGIQLTIDGGEGKSQGEDE